ncbi:hypothetical protein C8J57DRAFT_1250775 [Mycena rebaudengoi]|nr:hypothetical protein C8J57DRAFT_1250775 [Mycena rebaudengoi]
MAVSRGHCQPPSLPDLPHSVTRIRMPEVRELLASILLALAIYREGVEAGADFTLESIQYDMSRKEAAHAGASPEAKAGLPVLLDASSTVKRGCKDSQNPIYPPMWKPSRSNPDPPTLDSLKLKAITHTHWALILDFGCLYLMVQYLTHTSLQIYRRDVWETTIMNVSKTVRRFHVGMALVFPDYVFAFLTIDLLFQPTWAYSVSDFIIPPDIYDCHNDFLAHVAIWIREQLAAPSKMQGLACDAIREANTVFYGIGQTDLCSLSDDLVLKSKLQEQPVLEDTLIPRDKLNDLFDVFEPTLVSSALALDCNLGHLIFGEAGWASYSGVRSSSDDPLTSLYHSLDYSLEVTHLVPEFYEPLVLPKEQIRSKSCKHRPTYSYQGKKQMWSITPQFPANMTSSLQFNHHANDVTKIVGEERRTRLFKTIVKSTCGVTIGPLEYCGNARILHIGNVPVVSTCYGNPTIPAYHVKRSLCGRNRVASNLAKLGKRKRGRTDKENQKLTKDLAFLDDNEATAEEDSNNLIPKLKKRRLSADQRLALALLSPHAQ